MSLKLINEALSINEAIAASNKNQVRLDRYLTGVARRFKLGEVNESSRSADWVVTFGPIQNPAARGKYLHLASKYSKKTTMSFDSYSLTDSPKAPRISNFIEVPKWVVKFEYLVGLALYGGTQAAGNPADEISTGKTKYVVKKKDVNERFKLMGTFLNMVLNPSTPVRSIVVHGTGGTGKTHTLKAIAKDMGFTEGSDYKILSGKITPTKLYEFMLENSDGMLIFDDIDSVLTHPDAENFIKAALDTTPPTIVTWNSPANKTGVMEFEFTGKIIFLTNLELDQIAQPVKSRALPVNVTMTRDEVLDRIDGIIDKMNQDIPMEFKQEVWDFVKSKYHESGGAMPLEWNIRVVSTYFNAAWAFEMTGLRWKDQVLSLMESGL